MYEDAFGLTEKPFSLTPDPDYLFLSDSHQKALDHLLFGLESGDGFIVVTGEVGVGKTTVCRALLRRLSDRFVTSVVLNPMLTEKELIRGILEDFGAEAVTGGTKKDCLDALDRFLLASGEAGKRPVLIIDEAQDLTPTLLEQVRLLSNLETEKRKLIQIVLIGQLELKDKLSMHELRQLDQRVTVRAQILPLDRKAMRRYVDHRLSVAGGGGRQLVTDGAERALYRFSGGVPRVVNMLCDRAFLSAGLRNAASIEAVDVRRAADSIFDRGWRLRRMLKKFPKAAAALAGMAAIARTGRGA
jgi:general secretion pathway protein A